MKNKIDFNKNLYRFADDENLIISITLRDLLHNIADTVTSPKGVTTRLFVKKNEEGKYELCCWRPDGRYVVWGTYDTGEEAEEVWCGCVYVRDFAPGNDSGCWHDSAIEAIEDYVNGCDDEDVTVQDILAEVESTNARIEERKQEIAAKTNQKIENLYKAWTANHELSRKQHNDVMSVAYDYWYPYKQYHEISFRVKDMLTDDNLRKLEEMKGGCE